MFLDEALFLATWKKLELEGAFDNIKIYEDDKLNSGVVFEGDIEFVFSDSSMFVDAKNIKQIEIYKQKEAKK